MQQIIIFLIFFLLLSGCKRREVQSLSTDKTEEKLVDNTSSSPNSQKDIIIIESPESKITDDKPTIVKMTKYGGIYEIPVKINGVDMDFIFDTGASGISISETEAMFLAKQGKIIEEDIIGGIESIDALGNISEGTEINLREVQIGDRKLKNVQASVVHNAIAPILLGQSALSRFGKVTIDYQRMEITFE